MKFIQAKPSRLHCSNCDDTFTLPQNGNIKLYKELKCPLDDYELVLWTTGVKGKVMLYISQSGNNFLMYFRFKGENCKAEIIVKHKINFLSTLNEHEHIHIDDHNLSTHSWENNKLFEKTLSIVPVFN